MELKINLPNFPEFNKQTMQTILWSCVGGAVSALLVMLLLGKNTDTLKFATVDILAIENNDESELADAIKKNDQKKARAIMEQKVSRSRIISKTIEDVATEQRVVIVVNQAIAGGELPDLTQHIIQRLNETAK